MWHLHQLVTPDSSTTFLAEVRKLSPTLQQEFSLVKGAWWDDCERAVKIYLKSRAWDIAHYGEAVAYLTFPQPTIQSATFTQVADMVAFMVKVLQEEEQRRDVKHDAAGVLQHKEESQKELNKEFRNQIIPIPERPPARLLTGQERELLIGACRDEMRRGERDGWNAQATLTALDEFVEFCSLLSKPENHIMVHAGQYVEKPVNRRLVSDMAGEMAQALMRLPQYEAYAKIIQDRAGKKEVVTLRVRTPPPPPEPDWVSEAEVVMKYIKENPPSNFRLTPACQSWKRFIAELVEGSTRNDGICISRDVVEQEIGDRQAKWRKRVKFAGGEPPPPQIEMMPD